MSTSQSSQSSKVYTEPFTLAVSKFQEQGDARFLTHAETNLGIGASNNCDERGNLVIITTIIIIKILYLCCVLYFFLKCRLPVLPVSFLRKHWAMIRQQMNVVPRLGLVPVLRVKHILATSFARPLGCWGHCHFFFCFFKKNQADQQQNRWLYRSPCSGSGDPRPHPQDPQWLLTRHNPFCPPPLLVKLIFSPSWSSG